jgi:AraC family transcriptional regulator
MVSETVGAGYRAVHAARLDPNADVRGLGEGWVAPATFIRANEGFGEPVWVPAVPDNLLNVWLSGARTTCRWGPLAGKSTRTMAATLQPRGVPNHFEATGAVSFAQIFLPDELLDDVAGQMRPGARISGSLRDDIIFAGDSELNARVAGYLKAARAAASRVEMDARALLVVERLLGRHHRLAAAATEPRGLPDWQVKRVTDYLASAPDREVALAEMASLVQLSRFHFARAFKAATGIPPHRYQMRMRVQRARFLLESTNKPIGEIAAEVGYESPGHFSRLFRQETGVTPATYRRERRR